MHYILYICCVLSCKKYYWRYLFVCFLSLAYPCSTACFTWRCFVDIRSLLKIPFDISDVSLAWEVSLLFVTCTELAFWTVEDRLQHLFTYSLLRQSFARGRVSLRESSQSETTVAAPQFVYSGRADCSETCLAILGLVASIFASQYFKINH